MRTAILILAPAALLAGAAAVTETVAAFAARLKDAVDLDAISEDLARVVQTALEPAHVSVWTSRRG